LVLGPVEVRLAGANVDLGTPKQRALLGALALSVGRPVAVDTIVDLLWGDDAPPGVAGTLQSYVSGLRRVLEPERERRRPAEVLVTVAPGYALRLAAEATDAGRFVGMVAAQHRLLAGTALVGAVDHPRDVLTEAVDQLSAALDLWRGRPYAELDDAPDAVAERARLDDLRLVALEDRAVAALALGHHATVAAELEALTATHPLRERLWGLRAVALARSGRQADALETLSTLRSVLADELGLEPGIELRDLQTAVLRQDPALTWTEPAPGDAAVRQVPTRYAGDVDGARPMPAQVAPLVGRDGEQAALEALLDQAAGGTAGCALLVGEPGIGKSRLAAEVGRSAREKGFTVLLGRCSQDDGAPPFWPWTTVLGGLGRELPRIEAEAGDEGARFRAWEEITGIVLESSREQPVLLVMDDLHWADASSLGALRVLIDSMADHRLVVVGTRRTHPEPEGALADLGETAARRHALRLDLAGLGVTESAAVAQQVIGTRPSNRVSADLCARTEGNPFFIVEYARLAGPRGDLRGLLDEENPPTAVQDVLNRRIGRLPDETVAALRVGAVVGRRFDAPTLARATGVHEDDLLDLVEPAQAAGLLREDGIDRYAFAHALVVDTLLTGLRASRRARAHARVAEAIATAPGHEAELARHWLAAGPAYAAQAWRAAVPAAAQSSDLHDHDRAARLLAAALERLDLDGTATPRDRYDIVMALIDARRWLAMWSDMVAGVEQAIELGREIGDVELVARAAIATNQGSLWHSAPHGEVHEGVIAALRESLTGLPTGDGALRCRVMLSLAHELGHLASLDERRTLVAEAVAMAERIGDPALLLEARMGTWMPTWARSTTVERFEQVSAALALAREIGDDRAALVSSCLRCVALNDLGRPGQMFEEVEAARAEAVRLRIPFGLIVLDGLVLSWWALAGRFEECAEILDRIDRLAAQMSLENVGDAMVSAQLSLLRWQGRDAELAAMLESLVAEMPEFGVLLATARWRAGDHDGARAHAAAHPPDLGHEDIYSAFVWIHAAELALYLGDRDLGAAVGALLAPYAGESVAAGSMVASGPVDLYLALAAAACGETDEATRHADRAAELCRSWEIPLVGDWLERVRAENAF
jgi:DNA-binding SARP family transcriptional activator